MFILLVVLAQLVNGIKINNHFVKEPQDAETIIGSTIILHCQTEPLDENQVTWCKNDFCTLGKTRDLPFYPRYEIIGNAHQGEHHFKIINVSLEDIGMYQCQIRAGPRRAGSMSRKAKLTVLQIPSSLSIDSPVILIENILSFIICRANNAMPEAKLSWHFPSSISYLAKNDYALISGQSLRNSISNVTLIPSRSDHGKLIQCQAHSSALQIQNETMITQQYIQIYFPPEMNVTLIGQQIEGELILIQCNVISRPSFISIQWFNGTYLLNGTNQNVLSLLLTRHMHHSNITCQAKNEVGKRNESISLNIIYKPIFVDVNGNEIKNSSVILVNEGESVKLECLVDSSPFSLISWTFNGLILSRNQNSISIDNIQSIEHLGLYICSAHHPTYGIFNRTIRLALKGPPEMIEERRIYSVSIGESVRFICSISKDIPLQKILWSREDSFKIRSDEKYSINENRSDHFIVSTLTIENVLLSDQGFYLCTGINEYGSSITRLELRVIHLKQFFLQRSFLYGSILLGLILCFILIFWTLINRYRRKNDKRIRKKSSTTDETISSLPKQQENNPQDYQDETNSSVDQSLINEQFIKNDISYSPKDDFFYLRDNQKRYSTVV